MKTLILTNLDLHQLKDYDEDIRVEVQGAIVDYYFTGVTHTFKNEIASALFKGMFRNFQVRRSRSESGAKCEGTPKAKSKQNQSKTKAKSKQNQSKTKANVADTQSVTRIFNNCSKKIDNKETEKKEEIEESSLSSPTPLSIPNLEDKEEKKDKEKKEIYVYKESENEELTDEEKEDEFFKLMKEHYPRVMAMKQPLTYKQYKKLIDEDGYSSRVIKDILEQMENYAPLNRSYISANLTLRKWLKMRQNG